MLNYEDYLLQNVFILAIGAHYTENYLSKIEIMNKSVPSERSVKQLMDDYCLSFNVSYEGREASSRLKYKDVKNPSIIVSEVKGIAGFQVPSEGKLDKHWIFDLWHSAIQSLSRDESEIILTNGSKLFTPLSRTSVEKRRDKTWRLLQPTPFFYFPGRQNRFLFNESNDDYQTE